MKSSVNLHIWQPSRAIFYFAALILLSCAGLKAQSDSLQVIAAADSVRQAGARDSSLTKKVRPTVEKVSFTPVVYDFAQKCVEVNDSLPGVIWRFRDLIFMNYNGLADVFSGQPRFKIVDFMEPGLPRYVSAINMLPHQTSAAFEGHALNDPVTGLYNLRFISADMLAGVQAYQADAPGSALWNGLNFTARSNIPDEPYSRIMFRQGDFGYSDLDLQYANRLSERIGLQLGGINKYYDPNGYHGYSFRGLIHYQPTAHIYSRTRVHLNRETLHFIPAADFASIRSREERDEYFSDLTWRQNDSSADYYHLQLGYIQDGRHTSEAQKVFDFTNRYRQYQLGLSARRQIAALQLFGAVSASQQRISGQSFAHPYTDSEVNMYALAEARLFSSLRLQPAFKMKYRWGEAPLALPALQAHVDRLHWSLNLNAGQSARFPNRSELSRQSAPFHGNRLLHPEKINYAQVQMITRPLAGLELSCTAGRREIKDEIVLRQNSFVNDGGRVFNLLNAQGKLRLGKFYFAGSVQWNDAARHISPAFSWWLQGRYHDVWLKGALIIDAIGNVYWYGRKNLLYYQPQIERFYVTEHRQGAYFMFSYKIVATVKDAQLYMAMENPLSSEYQIIYAYPQRYRRVRFGVNWVLWD